MTPWLRVNGHRVYNVAEADIRNYRCTDGELL
jgi:hypothetical protein